MRILQVETQRLIIREYTADDNANHRRLAKASFDADVSEAAAADWLRWTADGYREYATLYQPPYGDRAVVLKATNEFIGSVGIVPSVIPWGCLDGTPVPAGGYRVQPEFGLFWSVYPAHRGNGYALEAVRPLVAWLFNTLMAARVVATTEYANSASLRVMEKLGMRLLRNQTGEPRWCEVVGVLDA